VIHSRQAVAYLRPEVGMAAMPLRLVSAPLEVFSGSRQSDSAISHNIPTDQANVSSSFQPAIAAGCYTDDNFAVITTPFADQFVLELQLFSLSSSQSGAKAHQLLFPSPILDKAYLSASENNSLTLQVCTATGIIYRILLPLDLLESIDEVPARWISEHRIASIGNDPQDTLEQGTLTSFHASQNGTHSLVACKDGRVIRVLWAEDARSSGSLSGEFIVGTS
jgi:hypothetical protein